jgi:hypothetical protein
MPCWENLTWIYLAQKLAGLDSLLILLILVLSSSSSIAFNESNKPVRFPSDKKTAVVMHSRVGSYATTFDRSSLIE